MSKRFVAAIVASCFCVLAYGQDDSIGPKSDHYIGIQANQLIKQILNFSNSNPAIDNPYLLTYAVTSRRTGSGLSIGLGYNFNETSDGDAISRRETEINDFSLRVGYEKKSSLGKRWMVGFGADIIIDKDKNVTVNINDSEFNKSNIETISTAKGFGLGPRLSLNFKITDRIMLGTEATYYFRRVKNSFAVNSTITTMEFDPNTGNTFPVTRTDHTETSDKTKRLQFSVPAVLFLTVKF
ncbi:MAG TPA: hypothetical protein VD816_17870 [Ohtaekwangia sp.]|nr:hypothetical protein [Ohtaekwangia sp.]